RELARRGAPAVAAVVRAVVAFLLGRLNFLVAAARGFLATGGAALAVEVVDAGVHAVVALLETGVGVAVSAVRSPRFAVGAAFAVRRRIHGRVAGTVVADLVARDLAVTAGALAVALAGIEAFDREPVVRLRLVAFGLEYRDFVDLALLEAERGGV